MKIHFFQRYHQKENVATANTMLLLSRFYNYFSDKFFRFLKDEFFSNAFEPEIIFSLQEKSVDSIPDAMISQKSFKIVVETKLFDWFYSNKLIRHLGSFKDEKYKVLLTLASELMDETIKEEVNLEIKEYNKEQDYPVAHKNTTFEVLANAIKEELDDRDYEMHDVLDDYLDYCYRDNNLILVSDAWKYLQVQLAGKTFDFNVKESLYYDNIDRRFRAHDYIGLYKTI